MSQVVELEICDLQLPTGTKERKRNILRLEPREHKICRRSCLQGVDDIAGENVEPHRATVTVLRLRESGVDCLTSHVQVYRLQEEPCVPDTLAAAVESQH